jgi:hypothetical protein
MPTPRRMKGEKPPVVMRNLQDEEYQQSEAMVPSGDNFMQEKTVYTPSVVITTEEQRRIAFDSLHAGMADFYMQKLKAGDLTAAEQSCVLKFLNDNGMRYGVITAKSPIAELLASMPFTPGEYEHE